MEWDPPLCFRARAAPAHTVGSVEARQDAKGFANRCRCIAADVTHPRATRGAPHTTQHSHTVTQRQRDTIQYNTYLLVNDVCTHNP